MKQKWQLWIIKFYTKRFKKKFPKFAKKQKVNLPQNWELILQEAIEYARIDNRNILFYYEWDENKMNANAALRFCIRINHWWALRLITDNRELVKDTFRAVVGHECAHDISCRMFFTFTKTQKFKSHINEIIADVYGMQLADFNRERALEIMKEREKYSPNRYMGASTHPSAVVRTRFVETYQVVCEDMIRELADGMGCKKEKEIRYVINKFSPYFIEEKGE